MKEYEASAEQQREQDITEKVRRVLQAYMPQESYRQANAPRQQDEFQGDDDGALFRQLLKVTCSTQFGIGLVEGSDEATSPQAAAAMAALALQVAPFKAIILDLQGAIDSICGQAPPAERIKALLSHLRTEQQEAQTGNAPDESDNVTGRSKLLATFCCHGSTLLSKLVFLGYRLMRPFWRLGQRLKPNSPGRRGTGMAWKMRIRDILLPWLDFVLYSALQDTLRFPDTSSSSAILPTLRTLAPLLYVRGRLFLSFANYAAAYDFFCTSVAWRRHNSKSLLFLGIAAQLSGHFHQAECAYRCDIVAGGDSTILLQNLAHTLLILNREEEAATLLQRALERSPILRMAHQNLAGNYDPSAYTLQPLDNMLSPNAMLYDAYNLAGERLVHIGRGDEGVACFGKAIRCQQSLAKKTGIPDRLIRKLEHAHGIDPALPLRILPYEWVALIGHIAMLDSYKKLQLLELSAPGQALVLAPRNKVANHPYLDLWREHFHIIEDTELVEELFPFQRVCGDCFNGYIRPDGSAGDWTELGAHGQIAWDAAGHGPLVTLTSEQDKAGRERLRALGLPEGSWFVALHIRSNGFHRESHRSMQTHRNASLQDYLPAIKAITDRGGWVIRMGDASMAPLPEMSAVIDYPHTTLKSPEFDIYLAARARFFIGTTSGLANAVISLGTPCLLVNCISNYFQLWNNRVLFTLKPIWSNREHRFLRIEEMVCKNFRWNIFNINRLAQMGMTPYPNSAKEIMDAVEEMLTRAERGPVQERTEADTLLDGACAAGGNPGYFGNGRLSRAFAAARPELFKA